MTTEKLTNKDGKNLMKMHTHLFVPEEKNFEEIMQTAGKIIRKGGLVAFPTETVYGLGADALNPDAVQKIFDAKGRPADNPLIVHVAKKEQFSQLAEEITPTAQKLMEHFCPGPLTLILKKKKNVPDITTAGLDSVAIRLPSNEIALELISAAGTPIAAPSANRSGSPSPTSASHVMNDLEGRIDAIIDGGSTEIGIESTVVDARGKIPIILRPGDVSREELEKVAGKVEIGYKDHKISMEKPLSPGMKYTHYSPSAKVILLEGNAEAIKKKIAELIQQYSSEGKKVGALLTTELQGNFKSMKTISLGSASEPSIAANRIFCAMREMDLEGMDIILVDGSFTAQGIGAAVFNRLRKASTNIINL
ncbi:L-threonylcarbamoyladenylate synthase [Methanohalophilus levihalophilus]|uniref:L-threonylcarbamoyladenylate synthase n=1 Tax=Methanohalophilus levihalophilus TaxID=1431282 RepID=UPI001FD8BD28|nr:L-threonylcarbamoyladenylate synthase [Methanohalophilus levihalophilus]MBP2031303.1 L-threonylcarbamoyladenylate synthase [Methanohalophilus levihalophilus]